MSKVSKLHAVFYCRASGREPVREWLRGLSAEDRKVVGDDIRVVQWGWPLGRPRVAHVRGDLWEVRSLAGNRQLRVVFALGSGEMVLLHGFVKKTRTAPAEEIAVAERRWGAWQGRQHQGEEDE